jgi:gamma-glutamylcyclotransferase (GGCT)/AIG2-like uncharacterized protein YtfP
VINTSGKIMLKDRDPEQSVLYFAYGANMDIEAMAWRCPNAQPRGVFLLRDWELQFYCHATIEPRPGSAVAGVLWALTSDCERSLDRFEGYPDYYTKRTWCQDGQWIMFYEMTDPKSGRPGPGYVGNIAESYQRWQLPQHRLQEALDDFA